MARIVLVITKVDGEVVYREEADTQIDFTGHLKDGSMIESGIYFYHCDMQWIIDGKEGTKTDIGYFTITHHDGKVYCGGMRSGAYEVPEKPSANMAILQCHINLEWKDAADVIHYPEPLELVW